MAQIRTTLYRNFKGVDRASDPTNIDNSRSPYAPNLMSDTDGFPEKRPGWRKLTTVEAPVNGLYYVKGTETPFFVVHGGTKLYRWAGNTTAPTEIYSEVHNARSAGFVFENVFYLLTGSEYLKYDGTAVSAVESGAYVPMIMIARKPDGGGETYESVNLLQPKRKVSFLADGTSTVYQLPSTAIDSVDEVTVNGTATSAYTADLAAGRVTFTTAPAEPATAGEDNVVITYSVTTEGYAARIKNCTIAVTYGYGSPDRVVVSGNGDYRHYDWISGIDDPSYFPDLGYSAVGSSESSIMGYARVGENLAIIKEDNAQDNTVFFRTGSLTESGEAIFPIRQAIVGRGAIAPRSFAVIDDEPVFLTRSGVCAITSNQLTSERILQNRSWFVDNDLMAENDLEQAVAVTWENRYMLCCPSGNAYLMDGNQNRSYIPQTNGDYIYECCEWTNIPAHCLLENAGTLYFGTETGWLCRFNTDIDGLNRYSDEGEAIDACWSTKADDDGDFMRYKTMLKVGSGVQLKPYLRSSVQVTMRTDEDFGRVVREEKVGIFNWEDIDFESFTFSSLETPRVVPFKTKVRKYGTLQIVVRNNKVNEGFGVLGIIKRYVVGRFRK